AIFDLPKDIEMKDVEKAIEKTNYQVKEVEKILPQLNVTSTNETDYDYDFLIIGSGSAAFAAAIRANEHGAKVGMIERNTIGGTCVNIGCVPSKTLLKAGEINQFANSNPFNGLKTTAGKTNLKSLVEQKDDLVSTLRQEKYIDLIDQYDFDFIEGEAKFVDRETVEVNGVKLTAKRFLISTGASSFVPEIKGIENVDYLTSTTLLELKEVPKKLTVIGSSYIGLELGQLFHNLGSEVTLIQRSERLLKEYDPEITEAVEKVLTEQGINLVTGATYERIEQVGEVKKVYVTVNGKDNVVESDQLLIATGRKPNTDTLNLCAAGVKVGKRNEIL